MKIDPHHHEQTYKNWKARGCNIPGILEANRKLILEYLEDMEIGAFTAPYTKKGSRSYGRLRNLKTKMKTLCIIFEAELNIKSLEDLQAREVLLLFKRLREGEIACKKIEAPGNYIKAFKAFWHWYQRSRRAQDKDIPDITVDLDARDSKPKFNYITIEQAKKLFDNAKYDYKALIMFLFDSGIRAPTEMMNVRVKDLEWTKTHYTLHIREETSKTFGRKIKLMLCSDILKDYIKTNNLQDEDYLFTKYPHTVNQYLKMLGNKILGIGISTINKYKNRDFKTVIDGLTMYDFRHASACYWLPRYKSESALKYRFGWKKSDMIHYYTELLGMRDTIDEEDLYVDVSKTQLENELKKKGNEIELLKEQLQVQDSKLQSILKLLKALELDNKIASQ